MWGKIVPLAEIHLLSSLTLSILFSLPHQYLFFLSVLPLFADILTIYPNCSNRPFQKPTPVPFPQLPFLLSLKFYRKPLQCHVMICYLLSYIIISLFYSCSFCLLKLFAS